MSTFIYASSDIDFNPYGAKRFFLLAKVIAFGPSLLQHRDGLYENDRLDLNSIMISAALIAFGHIIDYILSKFFGVILLICFQMR